ncbi:MAG: hypothetical protein GOV01_03645 [Candidatus Altiarchaeota archaeon]|nr:hypothetical protein [Candidatus Altiarchaeota archaeon]
MVIPILLVFAGFFVVFYSSAVDFLTTYLPEKLVKYSVPAGLAGWLAYGIQIGNFSFFLQALQTTVLAFIIGGALYYARHWASGDMWLMAVASSLMSPAFESFWPNFFIFSLVWAGLLGIIYYFYFFIRHKFYLKHLKLSAAVLVSNLILMINPLQNLPLIGITWIILILMTRKDVEDLFVIEKKVKDLEEDDWILEDLVIKGRTIKATLPIGKKEEAWAKKHGKGNLLVKSGVPMTPAFSMALLTLLFI